MKYLIGSIVTIIIGYIFSGMLSGVGVSDAYMSYINEVTLSVIFFIRNSIFLGIFNIG